MKHCGQDMERTTEREKVGDLKVTWITWTCNSCGAQETGRELPQPQYSAEDLDAILGGVWF